MKVNFFMGPSLLTLCKYLINLLGSYFKKLTNKTGKIGGLLFPQQSIPSEMYEHLQSVEMNQKIFKDQLI